MQNGILFTGDKFDLKALFFPTLQNEKYFLEAKYKEF